MSVHVGIDLGTTNTSLAYTVDGAEVTTLQVPQLVGKTATEARAQLPSFLYVAHESDGALPIPWSDSQRFAVGEYARTRGLDAPSRLVSSAKSWLCHPTMDRRAAMLPLDAPADVEKVSPVEASYHYLDHLSAAFTGALPSHSLSSTPVVLTVPASFDAAARELTVEAAFAAGLEDVTLLEEPQAAVYAWVASHPNDWREHLRAGDLLLVVDVGGGTTDFSAISVVDRDGDLDLERLAVGDHLLLGGDNMDLLLAHLCKQKLEADGKTVDRWQSTALVFAARSAKESLLSDSAIDRAPVAVFSKGSALVGGALRTEITREEVTRAIVDGFFPIVKADSKPQASARSGLAQVGLPYARDPAVTRHLASFLTRQASGRKPSAVLFNGGVMKSKALRERVLDMLTDWCGARPRELPGADYDLAVARGAAFYSRAKHEGGVRIRGGTARAFYVGIESPVPAVPGMEPPLLALCIAPFGMEEGTAVDVYVDGLGLIVGEKVRFRFFGSTVRREDDAGDLLHDVAELQELSPIEAEIPAESGQSGAFLPVSLRSEITAVGTLKLFAVDKAKSRAPWEIELAIRDAQA